MSHHRSGVVQELAYLLLDVEEGFHRCQRHNVSPAPGAQHPTEFGMCACRRLHGPTYAVVPSAGSTPTANDGRIALKHIAGRGRLAPPVGGTAPHGPSVSGIQKADNVTA